MNHTINNSFTQYTIDTYNTFTSDSHEELEMQNINEGRDTKLEYDGIEWIYDHKLAVELLSKNSIEFLLQEVDKNIIQDIKYMSSGSPREYNFSTDSYDMSIDYNQEKLDKFISSNLEGYRAVVKKHTTSYSGYTAYHKYEEALENNTFKLAYYLDTLYSDDYMDYMYENLDGVYMETVTYKIIT